MTLFFLRYLLPFSSRPCITLSGVSPSLTLASFHRRRRKMADAHTNSRAQPPAGIVVPLPAIHEKLEKTASFVVGQGPLIIPIMSLC